MRAVPIALLASGGGRSLENLAESVRRGELDVELRLVLADRSSAGALARAERLGIPSEVVPYAKSDGVEAFSRAVFAAVEARGCELVVLAGFLRLLRLPERWLGRVLNIHPALLPAFGGKGYYGERVHAAVLAAGVPYTGCSVHFVDNEYDHGPIILQRRVPVRSGEGVAELAERVFEEERIALPEAIRRVLSGAARYSGAT